MQPEHGHHEGAHQHPDIGHLRGELVAMDERHRTALEQVRTDTFARIDELRGELAAARTAAELEAAELAAEEARAAAEVAELEARASGAAADAALDAVEDQADEDVAVSDLEPPEVPAAPAPAKEPKERGMWDRYH